jgi:hypothetical protein
MKSPIAYARSYLQKIRDADRFLFAIPLIGERHAKNYKKILKLLSDTVASCANQTDDRFEICIACNEIPDIPTDTNKIRISYVVIDYVSANELKNNPWIDVNKKHEALKKFAIRSEVKYYFQLDADDLVRSNLVEYARRNRNNGGYIIESGYILDSESNNLYLIPNQQSPVPTFDQICGSSIIVTLGSRNSRENEAYLNYIWKKGHHMIRERLKESSRTMEVIPFPAAVYRINHGENIYLQLNSDERTGFIHSLRQKCQPVAGEELMKLKLEFSLAG